MLIIYLSMLWLVIQIVWSAPTSNGMSPIVIVPGIGGSQINAKLHRNKSEHFFCYKKYEDWYTIWLSIEELLPWAEECWVENFKLQWDDKSGRMQNVPGVITETPGFGNTSGIEWLDPDVHGPGVYFYPFVDALCKNFGYVRGKTLRAAPYDFRYDPESSGFYLLKLQGLIQQTYEENGHQPIVLISHSMGAPYTLYLLNRLSQEWKDKHIKSWITISGTYAGAMKALKAYISGDGFSIPKILDKPLTLRKFQRTFSSLSYILPDSRFWKPDEVIVKTNNRTYTISDYDDLFIDMGFPIGSKVFRYVPRPWSDVAPGIKTYCLHGAKVPTAEVLHYDDNFPDSMPDIQKGDGDGTVNFRSLEACRQWTDDKTALEFKIFDGSTHNGILGEPRLIEYVSSILKL